jgi:Carboxypeptidase regulatory-like domain
MKPGGSKRIPAWQAFLIAAAAFVAVATATTPAFAQAPVGSISGFVTDPSGALVAGASVSATSLSTGATRSVTSDNQGFFTITTLKPGEYLLKVSTKGFAEFVAPQVVVEVGQTARVDAALTVQALNEQVEVTGTTVAVDTSQTTVGGVVNLKQINELPLNGRNYLELARLQPGVEIQEGRSFDPTKSRYTGVSMGSRNGREARITIDGIDAVDEHVGTTTLNISQDSIQEFQVSTSSSDPSAGLSATGAINIITKRGGNDVHGSGFLFGRGSDYAARPSFAATAPDFDRKQFGGNAGGPALKDRLFWFANVEKTKENAAIGISTPYFPSLTSYAAPFDALSTTVRSDWHVSQKHDAFVRWSRDDNSSLGNFGGNRLPSSGNINSNTTHQVAGGLDTVLTSRLTNSFRAAVTDFKNRVLRPDSEAQAVGIAGLEGVRVTTDDGGLIAGPDNITPQSTFELFGQFRDDLTYSRGRHLIRGGADIVRYRVRVTNFVSGFPSFNVVSPASRNPADIANQPFINVTVGNKNGKRIPGTPDNSHRNTRISGYVEDTWRARPNLTLNFGARYEVDTHPLDNDLDKPALVGPILPHGTDPTPIDRNNLAPHGGVAWDPWNDGKTSIRVGAGIYYTLRVSNLVTNERASLAPFNSGNDTITLTAGALTGGPQDFNRDGVVDFDFTPALVSGTRLSSAVPTILAGQAVYVAAPPSTIPTLDITRTGLVISNELQTPYSKQFNAGIQRELPFGGVIDVNYIQSRTEHEFMRDLDAANFFPGNGAPVVLGDGRPPTNTITVITSNGYSQYRALTAKLDKRMSHHYQFSVGYALAKLETSTADGLGLGGGTLVNRDVQANFGTAPLDRRHRLTFNGIVELPKGFRLSSISTVYSGVPNSILVGSADINGDGINGDLLPGTRRGSLGREVKDVSALNSAIRGYNQTLAGTLNARGQRLPFAVEMAEGTRFDDSFISTDIQLSYVLKLHGRLRLEGTAQLFNAFNISNLVGPAGLPSSPFGGTLPTLATLPTGFTATSDGGLRDTSGNPVLAGVSRLPNGNLITTSFGSFGAVRPSIPTGTGLPRAAQFGLRVSF